MLFVELDDAVVEDAAWGSTDSESLDRDCTAEKPQTPKPRRPAATAAATNGPLLRGLAGSTVIGDREGVLIVGAEGGRGLSMVASA